jgi:hypothetical protein
MKFAHRKQRSLVSFLLIADLLAGKVSGGFERNSNSNLRKENLDLPLFDLYTLAGATMDFSEDSKLGEGGFGPVYKVLIYTQSCNFFMASQFHDTAYWHQCS